MNMPDFSSRARIAHIACYCNIFLFYYTLSPLSVQALQSRSCLSYVSVRVRVRDTLGLAVYRQSVRLGDKPLRFTTSNFFSTGTLAVIVLCIILSDERTGLSFTIAAGPLQRSHSQVRVPRDA
jgi:hypothetical protein